MEFCVERDLYLPHDWKITAMDVGEHKAAFLYYREYPEDPSTIDVFNLCVEPAYRRLGIGAGLLAVMLRQHKRCRKLKGIFWKSAAGFWRRVGRLWRLKQPAPNLATECVTVNRRKVFALASRTTKKRRPL